MPTMQEQYTDFVQRSQEATVAIVEAWTKSVQDASTRVPAAMSKDGAIEFVDQFFDFASKVIDVQRDLAKQVVGSSASIAGEAVKQATDAFNEAGASVTRRVKNTEENFEG